MLTEQRHRLPPMFQKNEVLFGHDGKRGLIAIEATGDKITIFFRDGESSRLQTEPFQAFLLMAGDDGLAGWRGEAKIERLAGQGAFNCLGLFSDLKKLHAPPLY